MSGRNSQVAKGAKLGPAQPDAPRRTDKAESQKRTFKVEDAAEILGISRGAAYARANDGSIPTIRMGKRLLVPKAALEKLLAGA
jgi:excisionase family DNA binding protein